MQEQAIQLVEFRLGRNVKSPNTGVVEPMDGWDEFIGEAVAHLEGVADGLQSSTVRVLKQWVEVHTGAGSWEGVPEESAVVTLYTDGDLVDLEPVLFDFAAEMAWRWGQDAVAVVVGGVSTLVPALVDEEINAA
jgi:hypothetical protein